MSEQDGTQSSAKQRRSRKTSTATQQNGKQVPTAQRPAIDDTEAWKAYWKAEGQPWRTELEIDEGRQKYLDERRSITPDIEKGIYPFKDIEPKLTRADVEWLLSTHENGLGPVDWSEVNQRDRWGLDLRGANLSRVNLHNLPLARLRGGLTWDEWLTATSEQRYMAGVKLVKADLFRTHLEGARLRKANFENANLSLAHLQEAYLDEASMEGTNLFRTHLEGASLREAHLENTVFYKAIFDTETSLEYVSKLDTALLADVHWGGVSLANSNVSQLIMLGDENKAQEQRHEDKETKLYWYHRAVRANRQLAIVLRSQGLNEEADRFAYRAQLLERKVLWHQYKFGRWLFSLLLAVLSGYGYRIWRIIAAYVVVVSLFALCYFVLGMHFSPHLHLEQAYLESITAFHGRVFLEQFSTNTPQIWLTALEAIAGLIIEGVFIAMLIQRFFGK